MGFGERIRDLAQMPDGRIAMLTDSWKVIFLRRAKLFCQLENDLRSIYSFDAEEVCIDVFSLLQKDADPLIRSLRGADIGPPAMRSHFEVFVHENLLIYLKIPCSIRDFRNRLFLHVTPLNANDIADEFKQFGFNVHDFNSFDQGVGSVGFEGGCLVVRTLPEYEIKHVYTGQVIREESPDGEVFWTGPVWEGSYTFGTPYLATTPVLENSPPTSPDKQAGNPGAALFTAYCAGCHNLTAEHSKGPHLDGVIGRREGNVADFNASTALTALNIVWTQENLAEYITDPAQFAPGTTMASVRITDEEAQILVKFLTSN